MKIFQDRNLIPTGKYLIIYHEILLCLSPNSLISDEELANNFIKTLTLYSHSDFDEPVSLLSPSFTSSSALPSLSLLFFSQIFMNGF
jgi:hypothetical protein